MPEYKEPVFYRTPAGSTVPQIVDFARLQDPAAAEPVYVSEFGGKTLEQLAHRYEGI